MHAYVCLHTCRYTNTCMHTYACIHVGIQTHTCIRMPTYMKAYKHTCIYKHIHAYACLHTCRHTNTYMHPYAYIHVGIQTHAYICLHTCRYTNIYMYTHTHIYNVTYILGHQKALKFSFFFIPFMSYSKVQVFLNTGNLHGAVRIHIFIICL